MRWALAGLSLLLAAWAAPAAAQFDPGGLAARLQAGMTVSQVLLALGYRPTSTAETACSEPNGNPFACRIWHYATDLQELQIFFRYDPPQQRWLVYGWRI
jgi:hypothetical protein